ncbi:MAG: lipoyl(octanoyl) transferase LipB [Solirubrobacteraceae bacterium]
MPDLWVCNLGLVPYADALALQLALRAARQADEIPDTLLLLEHPAVYTRGRRSTDEELPFGEAFYAAQGIELVDVDRGGRVTYHGPGQLVGYPIMAIGDIIGYLRTMERAIIAALLEQGIEAQGGGERPTGVWAGGAKIASIGVHVSRRVSTHGFAVNAENDLEPFEWIVPCGLQGVRITSIARETGRAHNLAAFRASIAHQFALAFEREAQTVAPERLSASVAAPLAG